jgi:hypothetical protein
MTPLDVLSFTVCATAVAVAAEAVVARRRRRVLRRLAAEWRMTYSRSDTLRLAPKVARGFPIPGAANLRVSDVIYGIDHERYRYVFRAEFTTGTIRGKRRVARVATFSEPRDRQRAQATPAVTLAPRGGKLVDQYRHLAPAMTPRAAKPQAAQPAPVAADKVPGAAAPVDPGSAVSDAPGA